MARSLLSRAVDWMGGDPEMFDESIQPIKDNINEFMDTPVELSYKDNTFGVTPRDMFRAAPGPALQPANLSKLYNTATKNISKSFDKYGPLAFSPLNVPGVLDRVNDAASYFNEQWQNAKDKKNSNYIPGIEDIWSAAEDAWRLNRRRFAGPEVDNRPSVGPGNYVTAYGPDGEPGYTMPYEPDTTMHGPMQHEYLEEPLMDSKVRDLLNPFWNPDGPLYMDPDDYFDSETDDLKDVSEWPRIMNQAVYDTNNVNKRFTSPTKIY